MIDSGIKYVGVDGCKAGWIGVGLGDGVESCVTVCGDFSEVLTHFGDASVVLVDIPIGLPDGIERGGRACDIAARKVLNTEDVKKGSSVFPAPSRRYLKEAARNSWWSNDDYNRANGWSWCELGGGISKQAFSITQKIDEVDKILTPRDKDASPEIREVHPEVCFWALNRKKPMPNGKKSKAGFDERKQIVRGFVPKVDDVLKQVRDNFAVAQVANDDVLDALAAAITAKIGCQQGEFETLPETPLPDSEGLTMEMVYALHKDKTTQC